MNCPYCRSINIITLPSIRVPSIRVGMMDCLDCGRYGMEDIRAAIIEGLKREIDNFEGDDITGKYRLPALGGIDEANILDRAIREVLRNR